MGRNETLILLEFGVFSTCALLSLAAFTGLPLHVPNSDTIGFIIKHYVGPISLGAILALLVQSFRISWQTLASIATHFISVSLICFTHFNLKLLAMLINKANFDLIFWKLDQKIIAEIGFGEWLYAQLGLFDCAELGWYHDIFVALFFIVLLLAAKDKWLFECIMGICVILILGGGCYALLPAWGPFIFEQQEISYPIQKDMLQFYQEFILTHGTAYKPSNFIMAVAAMPSLHVAHSAFFALMVWTRSKAWFGLFLVFCTYLAWSAIILKWHYSLDVIGGLGLSIFAWWLMTNIKQTGLGRLRLRLRAMLFCIGMGLIFIYWINGK